MLEKAYKMDGSIDGIINDLVNAYELSGDSDKACKLLKTLKQSEEFSGFRAKYCL